MLKLKDKDFWSERILIPVMEYGIYILVIFLFADKGEAFRSFGLYAPPIALLVLGLIKGKFGIDIKQLLFIVLLGLFISGIFSSIYADDPLASFIFFRKTYLKIILIYLVITTTFSDPEKLKRLIYVVALTAVVFIAFAYYDYVTLAIMPDGSINYDRVRKYSTCLPYLIPFIPYVLITCKDRWFVKGFWLLVLLFGVVAVLLSGFRGGWASLFISLSAWGVFVGLSKSIRPIIYILIGLLVAGSVVFTILPASHIRQRIEQGLDSNNRFEWGWTAYIHIYNKSPILKKLIGNGLDKETMSNSYREWYREKTGRYPSKDYFFITNPHNHYLYLLFKQGFIGLFFYILLIVVYVGTMIKAMSRNPLFTQKSIGIAIISPFIGEYVVRGIVESLQFMPLGILLGIAGAYLSSDSASFVIPILNQ